MNSAGVGEPASRCATRRRGRALLHASADGSPAGGVCLVLVPDPGGGILVSWRQQGPDGRRRVRGAAVETAVQRTMHAAVADVLTEMGFPVTSVGTTGCHLVTATQRLASTS